MERQLLDLGIGITRNIWGRNYLVGIVQGSTTLSVTQKLTSRGIRSDRLIRGFKYSLHPATFSTEKS
tara:strand:- start:359 stop:559 length:201 start_codon:yes stop_codon:yes gene_type:complete